MKNHKLFRTGSGRSFAVVIPPDLIEALGWRDGEIVTIKKLGGAVVIRNAKTKKRK